jgi:EF hand domain-containing protein
MKSVRISFLIAPWLLVLCMSFAYAGDSGSDSAKLKSREKAFQKLDRDRDQIITPQEWRADVQTFLNLDCNRDQMVSREEYIFADCKMDQKDMAFQDLDRNGNKVIELNEWNGDQEEFNRLDRDHDGILTRSEFSPNKKSQILKQILGQIVVGP